jgi:hypothetical protein
MLAFHRNFIQPYDASCFYKKHLSNQPKQILLQQKSRCGTNKHSVLIFRKDVLFENEGVYKKTMNFTNLPGIDKSGYDFHYVTCPLVAIFSAHCSAMPSCWLPVVLTECALSEIWQQ